MAFDPCRVQQELARLPAPAGPRVPSLSRLTSEWACRSEEGVGP